LGATYIFSEVGGPTGLVIVIVAKSEVSPDDETVIVDLLGEGPADSVTEVEMLPAEIVAVLGAVIASALDDRSCTTMFDEARVGFPLESVRAMTSLPVPEVISWTGCTKSLIDNGGLPKTET
jgi:hypothetical protein